MRIISGRFARRTLRAPAGREVRPTSDRVREALFSALESIGAVEDARVLDLFAGSGALGLEALSRGARSVTLVERHAPAIEALRANVEALGAGAEATVAKADVFAWLRRAPASAFDLVLADPPYDLPRLVDLPALAASVIAPGGLLVIEHDPRVNFDDTPGRLWSRRYGGTVVSAFGT
jgi:16S rRNA (guanine(966)-N(2))-methyltransferase RsmD